MKKICFVLLACMVSFAAVAQHTIKSEEMTGITAVVLNGRMKVDVIVAEKCYIDAQLMDTELKRLNWTIKNNVLTISFRPSTSTASASVKLYIPNLVTSLTAERAEVKFVDSWSANMLNLSIGSGANVIAKVDTQDLDIVVSGNSVGEITGAAKYLTIRATSNSKIDCRKLEAQSVTADAATGAEVFVEATERIAAVAKTGGLVNYNGKPAIVRSYIPSMSMGSAINNTQRDL